jgi:acetyl esterase/lipase
VLTLPSFCPERPDKSSPGSACGEAVLRKSKRRKILIVLALVLLGAIIGLRGWKSCKSYFSYARSGYDCASCFKDLEYVPGSADPLQRLDLYIPATHAGERMPVVIWIHGGAWVAGDKAHPPAQPLLDRGFAVASLNYRLSDKHHFPAQIFDCKAALRFLRAHAAEYKLDPERFGVWGQSAGGHLVALLGTSGDIKELEGDLGNKEHSSRVQAVADWCGPTDLVSVDSQASPECKIDFKSPTNPIATLLGPGRTPQEYLAASPIKYVRRDNPPFLILHAEDDDVVPVGQARELAHALKDLQVPVLCHIAPDGGHGLGKKEFLTETVSFFERELKQAKIK